VVLAAYLRERFPLAPYAVLVALFHGAASLYAVRLGGGEVRWWVAPAILLAFFHLRVFDEHKDYAKDCTTHPERLLSRGVVTLRMLKIWGAIALCAQAAIAVAAGRAAFLAWTAATAFTVAMRVEFGVGAWLNRHLLTYAITHNPIVALLAMFSWASTGARWDWRFLPFLGMVSVGSLALEIGRKTRQPDEEVRGVESYSSVHRRERAGLYVYALIALSSAFTVVCLTNVSPDWQFLAPVAVGVVVGRACTRPDAPAKKVETGASIALLANCAAVAWVSWPP
jgi:4-hydroxybenzoate polyprenyltransferase